MRNLLCIVLALISIFSSFNVKAEDGVYEYTNSTEQDFVENVLKNRSYKSGADTSVFEGHPTYLLDENFLEDNNELLGFDSQPAGWDVDRRGGLLRTDGARICLMDGDPQQEVSMTHELLPHKSGDLTLETSMYMKYRYSDGFFYELSGNGKVVLRIETKGTSLAYSDKNGRLIKISEYIVDSSTPIKAVVHMDSKTIDIVAGGVEKKNIPFMENADSIDKIKISTSKYGEMAASPEFVHIYINYIVKEGFMTASLNGTPYDWGINEKNIRDTGVQVIESARVDTKSYKLSTSSVLEKPLLSKSFNANSKKLITEFSIMIPKKQNGVFAGLMSGNSEAVTISVKNGDFIINDKTLYKNFCENLWYKIKLVTDSEKKTADVYVNYNLIAERIPFANGNLINGIQFSSGYNKASILWVDDVMVYEDLPKMSGYPEQPRTVNPEKNVDVGMVMFSMWREGYHFGWDRLSPYEERTPYMGYYTEGSAETADWETKWLLEHGVTFQIFPFCGLTSEEPSPIKRPIRSQALNDGLLAGKYPMKFTFVWTPVGEKSIRSVDYFRDYILPYWVEYYFKNPNFMTKDNKLLIYTYATTDIIKYMGGPDAFKACLKLINEAAAKLGFDGAIVVGHNSLTDMQLVDYDIYRYQYSWGVAADDPEAIIKANTKYMETGDYRKNIPSICQGYNNTPWRVNSVGFLSPQEFEYVLKYVADNNEKWKAMGNELADLLTLTCWNEWGEGHFFAPSRLYGFSYMNSVRNLLTSQGVLHDEQLPDEKSLVRMNVLYPEGRQTLKIMPDQVAAYDDKDLKVLERIDFSNPDDFARLEIEKSTENLRNENGTMTADAVANDPSIFINDVSIDAGKIKQIKIYASQANGSSFTIYYQTTADTDMGVRNKRFAASFEAGTDLREAVLLPADTTKLKGTVTRLRIDPDDKTFGEFKVSYIEILGTDEKNVSLTIDGAEYDNNTPIRMLDDTAYMSVYKYFYATQKTNVVWCRKESRLHIDYMNYSIDMYDGDEKYTINGEKHTFSSAPFYADGNFFVPVKEFFEKIGFKVGWDDEGYAVTLESKSMQEAQNWGESAGDIWDFNVNDYFDGWSFSPNSPKQIVKNGILRVGLVANPAIMRLGGLNINTADYNYVVVKIKNQSDANKGRIYFTNEKFKTYGNDTGYVFDISGNDKSYQEYTIDLKSNENYDGIISQLRFDLLGKSGACYIDSIKLIK